MLKKLLLLATIPTVMISCTTTTKTVANKPTTTTKTTTNTTTTTKTGGNTTSNTTGKTTTNTASYTQYAQKLGTTFKGTEDINFLKEVTSWLGTPYLYASNTKGKGTDCSGFVSQVFLNTYGIKLNRVSSSMVANVNKVDRNSIECGDILFFANSSGKIYHVGISLGGDRFVHSATSNNVGVKTETLTLAYYKQHYYMAGRVKQLDKRSGNNSTGSNTKIVETIATKPSTYEEFSEQMGVAFAGKEDLKLLTEISEWMGTPFRSGKSDKKVGTDGLGFVTTVYKNVYGKAYERNAETLMASLTKITKANLQFGDIIVYKKDDKYPIIGIYLGDNKIAYTSVNGVATVDMALGVYELYFCGRPAK